MLDDDEVETSTWDRLPEDVANSLSNVLDNGAVPPRALALYARWWQFETWLRSLAYVELRAQRGADWRDGIGESAVTRQAKDGPYEYMASPDWEDPLAYLDASKLFGVIERNWKLFEPVLPVRESWEARRAELLAIRNRIGHLRRPHQDDINKLEQTLRDMERGTFKALAAYNRHLPVKYLNRRNAVVSAFASDRIDGAPGLITHIENQYEMAVRLSYTLRPWVQLDGRRTLNPRTPGLLWNLGVYGRQRKFNIRRLWAELSPVTRTHVVHLLATNAGHFDVTFSGLDTARSIKLAIGNVLHAGLYALDRTEWNSSTDNYPLNAQFGLDSRVQINTPWALIDESMVPITIFAAGGGGVQEGTT